VLFGKTASPGARGLPDKMNRVFESKNEMAVRLREFSRSARSSDTIRTASRGRLSLPPVTEADVWSDDPRSPNYNRHIVIDPKNPPDNYTQRKCVRVIRLSLAHEIRHNSDPPVPRRKRDFFHIRRGVNRPTTGCTTMARKICEADHVVASERPSVLRIVASRRIR